MANKMNSKETIYKGIKFPSRLELYMYRLLEQNNIEFTYQVPIVLQPKFKYGTESIRDIKYIADFVLKDGTIIETKGFRKESFNIKWKMLKYLFHENPKKLHLPRNQKNCNELMKCLKTI